MLNFLLDSAESVSEFSEIDLVIAGIFLILVCAMTYTVLRPFVRNNDDNDDTCNKCGHSKK